MFGFRFQLRGDVFCFVEHTVGDYEVLVVVLVGDVGVDEFLFVGVEFVEFEVDFEFAELLVLKCVLSEETDGLVLSGGWKLG